MKASVTQEIVRQVKILPDNLQRQVLAYVETLNASTQHGIPGSQLLRFAGTIPADDLERMSRAIETDCEQINPSEW
ncbi:MAG: hypothetical protein NTU83_01385 [Candidatus Hydrogenedentes bacterium]|nr:hypothetical protein [Candidatus Hydrogenedentota bacterium]